MSAFRRLQIEYNQYLKDPNNYYTIEPNDNNFLEWKILLFGPSETIYEGGIFECKIIFPETYPNNPPEFIFITPIPHPNIYENGKVCISILHNNIDISGYEDISEQWKPSLGVETIIMSILTLFTSPNIESPANIDISKLYKNNYNEYKKIIYKLIANQ
jgi:ubiquitin-conjugating enzyme E2 G1